MSEENIPVITDREELYDKCENMEQLFDKYYLPLLDKHYSKTYQLQQENQELKKHLEVPKTYNLKTLEDYKSYYEDATKEEILEDTYIDYCAYVNLAHRYAELKKQLEEVNATLDTHNELINYMKNQQKEFIKYLENMLDNENDIFSVVRVKDVLSKYKKIIGGK